MHTGNPLRAVAVTLIGALAALTLLGACSDADDELTGPPIPTLGSADNSKVETVGGGTLNATCACELWWCGWGQCGYDTATDSRGACCLDCADFEDEAEPKPSCDGGGGGGGGGQTCSETLGAGQCGDMSWKNPGGFCRTNVEAQLGDPQFDYRCISPMDASPGYPPYTGDYYFGDVCSIEYNCCYGGNYGDPVW